MKTIGTSMLIAAPFLHADAELLTPDQALQRLEGSSIRFRISGNSRYRLAHTERLNSAAQLYVFNRSDNGFIVASADDRLPALLGYSDNGSFDPSNASPELKWWLSQYAAEASFYLQNPDAFTKATSIRGAAKANRANIPELLTTSWDQGDPYNLDCPEDGRGKCVTGCVATAMAQVIRYHAYPTHGYGQHSYSWNGQTLSYDYANATFDYANMLDEYDWNGGDAPEQRKAVANLMYACGVGVNMSYSTNESGAGDMYIPYALKTFFGYDPATRLLWRNCFSSDQWEDMIYEELAANRPVLYGGKAPGGGHQFVCDGYSDGYYHINWGWSGNGNGYFLLSALDPGLQGIGGFAGGYNSEQTMIAGAQPNTGSGSAWYPVYSTGGLNVRGSYVNGNCVEVHLETVGGGVYNYYPEAYNLALNLKLVSESGREYLSDFPTDLMFPAASGLNVGGYNGFGVLVPGNLEPGKYKGYLGFTTPEGNWQDVLFPITVVSYVDLTVESDGTYNFTEGVPVEKAKIRVTEFAPAGTVVSGEPTRFNLSIENVGEVEFSGVITVKVFDKENRYEELASNGITLSVAAGEVFSGYVSLTYTLADGEYDVLIYDQYNDIVSDVLTLVVGKQPVKVSDIALDQSEASMEVDGTLQLTATIIPEDAADKDVVWSSSNPEVANVDQNGLVTAFTPGLVTITATSAADESIAAKCQITVNSKVIYVSSVTLDQKEVSAIEGSVITLVATVLPEDATDKTLSWSSSNEEVASVDQNGTVTVINVGFSTITATSTDGSEIKAECIVTCTSGIEFIFDGAVSVDIYTINGQLIRKNVDAKEVSNLEKGSYIIRAADRSYKIIK